MSLDLVSYHGGGQICTRRCTGDMYLLGVPIAFCTYRIPSIILIYTHIHQPTTNIKKNKYIKIKIKLKYTKGKRRKKNTMWKVLINFM